MYRKVDSACGNSKQHAGFQLDIMHCQSVLTNSITNPFSSTFKNPLHIEGHSTTTKVAGCFFLT